MLSFIGDEKINAGRRRPVAGRKKRPAAARRGSHVASPLGRFRHSPFEYNGRFYELCATSYTQKGAVFVRQRLFTHGILIPSWWFMEKPPFSTSSKSRDGSYSGSLVKRLTRPKGFFRESLSPLPERTQRTL